MLLPGVYTHVPHLTLLALVLLAAPASWESLDKAARSRALAEVQPLPLDARLLAVSERFLGTPYGFSPLGEGEGVDADPRLRWDRVDCVTFVEETIALSLAHSPEEVLPFLDRIRYRDGTPSYTARNHLMEADWLPDNARAGFVRDVTKLLGGPDAVRAEKTLGPASWESPAARALALPDSVHVTGVFPFGLLPLAKVQAHAKGFPSGTILLVVREDGPDRITRVSHLGLIVQRAGHTYLRHATSVAPKAVVDEELEHFLLRQQKASWKVVGVSLWEVLPPKAGATAAKPG
jgi:Protein of unknown function (DUF1460)